MKTLWNREVYEPDVWEKPKDNSASNNPDKELSRRLLYRLSEGTADVRVLA